MSRLIMPLGDQKYKYNANIPVRAFDRPKQRLSEGEAYLRGLLGGEHPFKPREKNILNPFRINALLQVIKERSKGKSKG